MNGVRRFIRFRSIPLMAMVPMVQIRDMADTEEVRSASEKAWNEKQ